MKKTAVLSAVALAIGLGSATSGFAADNRIGVTIYKYDDNFMSLMRKEIDKEAKALGGIELLMNDSQNAQSIQNDQVDGLLSKGVKALAINLVDQLRHQLLSKKRNKMTFLLFSSIKTLVQKQLVATITLTMLVQTRKNLV